MSDKKPAVPPGLTVRGRRFWRDTVEVFDLSRSELELLRECCATLDEIDGLQKVIADEGLSVTGSEGQPRPHPALSQIRASRTLVGRLLAQLSLPDEDGGALPSAVVARAKRAAQTRWASQNALRAVAGGR